MEILIFIWVISIILCLILMLVNTKRMKSRMKEITGHEYKNIFSEHLLIIIKNMLFLVLIAPIAIIARIGVGLYIKYSNDTDYINYIFEKFINDMRKRNPQIQDSHIPLIKMELFYKYTSFLNYF